MAVDAGRVAANGPSAATRPHVNSMRAWSVTGLAVLFIVVNWADKAILGLAAQPLMADLGLTPADIGYIGSAFYFLYAVTAVITGFVSDRTGVRWVLFALAILWSVTQLPVLLWATGAALLIGRIALGAAEGPAASSANIAAYGWFPPERRGLPSALISAGASIAKIAAAPLLTLVIVTMGWRSAFLALAIFGLVWSVAWLFVGKQGPYRVGSPRTTASAGAPLRVILTRPTFIGGVIGTATMYGLVTVVLTWLPSYFESGLGYTRLQAGSMVVLPSIVSMVVMISVSALADRGLARGRSPRAMYGLISATAVGISGALLALLPLAGAGATAVAWLSIGYGLGGVCLPLMNAAVSMITPAGQQPSVLAIFLALQSLSGLIAPSVTGILVEQAATPVEGYTLAFQVFGVAALAGGLILALTVRPERDRQTVQNAVAQPVT